MAIKVNSEPPRIEIQGMLGQGGKAWAKPSEATISTAPNPTHNTDSAMVDNIGDDPKNIAYDNKGRVKVKTAEGPTVIFNSFDTAKPVTATSTALNPDSGDGQFEKTGSNRLRIDTRA